MGRSQMTSNRLSSWMQSRWAWLLAGVLLAALFTTGPRWPGAARADVTEEPPQKQFLSGGARSEIVLREISDTLKRIDARLERMENAVKAAEEGAREPADKAAAGESVEK
jgi:hypothetical protein